MSKRYITIYLVIYVLLIIVRYLFITEQQKQLQGYGEISDFVHTEPIEQGNNDIFQLRGIWIRTSKYNSISIGDYVQVSGTFETEVINKLYVKKWLVYPQINRHEKFAKIVKNNDYKIPVFLLLKVKIKDIRNDFISQYNKLFISNDAALIAGMTLGVDSQFSKELKTIFRKSGLQHLVVASGSNLIMVASIINVILTLIFSRRKTILMSYMFIFLYTLISGLQTPIIRAAIMISIVWLSVLLGRKTSKLWILANTCLLMLIIDPLLIFSVSFQLSVAATSGLMLFGSFFNSLLDKIITSFKLGFLSIISGDISQTLAAQILVLPIILSTFGEFSLLSIFANICVGITVPIIVAMGFLILFLAYIVPAIAQFMAYYLHFLLIYIISVAQFIASLNLAVISSQANWFYVIYFILVLVLLIFRDKILSRFKLEV